MKGIGSLPMLALTILMSRSSCHRLSPENTRNRRSHHDHKI
jgi:hypothetical protein